MGHAIVVSRFDFSLKEVLWNTLVIISFRILTWDHLTSLDDLHRGHTQEESTRVGLVIRYLLICETLLITDEQVDLVLAWRKPLYVAFSPLVELKALVRFTITFKPVAIVEDSLGLENLLSEPAHVCHDSVLREVVVRPDGQLASLL